MTESQRIELEYIRHNFKNGYFQISYDPIKSRWGINFPQWNYRTWFRHSSLKDCVQLALDKVNECKKAISHHRWHWRLRDIVEPEQRKFLRDDYDPEEKYWNDMATHNERFSDHGSDG